jgi:addiction module HigA family antidote
MLKLLKTLHFWQNKKCFKQLTNVKLHFTIKNVIRTEKDIKNKALRQLYETGKTKIMPAEQIAKLENILAIMDFSSTLNQFKNIPGYRLHQLKGELKDFWSITVTGNYRIIFKFDNGYFTEIDYIDYH